jgi:hypothetical protein
MMLSIDHFIDFTNECATFGVFFLLSITDGEQEMKYPLARTSRPSILQRFVASVLFHRHNHFNQPTWSMQIQLHSLGLMIEVEFFVSLKGITPVTRSNDPKNLQHRTL